MVLPAAGEIRTIEGHTRRQPAYRSERARAVFLIPFSTSIADAALQLQSTLGARKADVSFRPDYTVGPGITPGPTAAAARGLSSSLLPPVGNFTLPQRTIEVYAAPKTCQMRPLQAEACSGHFSAGLLHSQIPCKLYIS